MTSFGVWAPRAKQVELVFEPDGQRVLLQPQDRGHFIVHDERIRAGKSYRLSLDGGAPIPDPRSEHQPLGVHGPSCWVDFDAFAWTDQGFQQTALASAVFYELHIGTFTPGGTFESAIERLPELRELGVTHVEVMPVAHFSGSHGWGYDGVCLFAPHSAYGGPKALQAFVNACHEHGVAVVLDVVYNHLGPSGNYLPQLAPYFSAKYHTPWGDAVNFDAEGSDGVRRFVCDNALHWLKNYHFDGLRLDAVHAIFDQSATHILAQLAQEVAALSLQLGKPLIVVAESGLNDARIVNPSAIGGYAMHAQWNDDFHHALHAILTGESSGYYKDFGRVEDLAQALLHGFVYRGQYSPFRDCSFGGSADTVRGSQLVVCNQNHDQVGNRATGDRLSATLSIEALKIAAAVTLLAPFVPLLFMGEEWAAGTPFQYFTDHEESELQEAVREGRRREFAAFGWDPDDVPDPGASATFERSKLDWSEREREPHASVLRWYAQLLALRRSVGVLDDGVENPRVVFDEQARWLYFERGSITVACNFATERHTWVLPGRRLRLRSTDDVRQQADRFDVPGVCVIILELTDD